MGPRMSCSLASPLWNLPFYLPATSSCFNSLKREKEGEGYHNQWYDVRVVLFFKGLLLPYTLYLCTPRWILVMGLSLPPELQIFGLILRVPKGTYHWKPLSFTIPGAEERAFS